MATGMEDALQKLATRIHGVTVVRGNADSDKCSATSGLLRRIPCREHQPLLIALPETLADVQACVAFANEWGKSLSVVGGAHSPFCVRGEVVLDLQRFCGIEIEAAAQAVTVGGGVIAQQVQEACSKAGLMVALGTSPTVGVGLILQGGIGHLTRQCGLALDALVSADVVVADGRCLTVSVHDHKDLFWALSGCGTNFGVVVSLTLRAYQLRPFAICQRVFAVPEEPQAAGELLSTYAERAASLPRNGSADCILHYGSDGTLRIGIYDYYQHNSNECVRSSQEVSAEVAKLPAQILQETILPCVSLLELFDHEPYLCMQPQGTMLEPGPAGLAFYCRAVFLASPMCAETASQLLSVMRSTPCRHCFIHLQHAGGAVADRSPTDSAFDLRALEWSVVVSGSWPKSEQEQLEPRCVDWVRNAVRSLLPAALGTYSTDLGPEDGEFAKFAFGSNHAELRLLKHKWDPKHTFGCGYPLVGSSS